MSTRIAPDVRRQQLLRVAEHIFANQPYDTVSIQQIADEAGVTRGLVHHYFGSRDGVMAALIREIAPDIAPDALPLDAPLSERVEKRVEQLMEVFESHSEAWLATLALGPNLSPPLSEVAAQLWERQYLIWQETFSDVVEKNDRTRALYTAYRGLNQSTCRLWLNGEISRDEARRILVTAQEALLERVGPTLS